MGKRRYERHGMFHYPEYSIWQGMRDRCSNPKAAYFHCYGGRGIKVCERWEKSFSAFFNDMGPRPEGFTIERRNNDGNYEPSNCYWATIEEQAQNHRTRSDNSTGVAGISFDKSIRSYRVRIRRYGKIKVLGCRRDFFEAVCLRKSAELSYMR